jgi:GNAT superfamily N-acetyltransferase
MTLIIRRATLTDSDQVFALCSEFATSFTPNRIAFGPLFDRLVTEECALLIVADESTHLVGYLLGFDHPALFANGRVSWVEELMVSADQRRRAIGKRLMMAFEDWACSRGSQLVALATRRAEAFYLALGYEPSATYFRKLV